MVGRLDGAAANADITPMYFLKLLFAAAFAVAATLRAGLGLLVETLGASHDGLATFLTGSAGVLIETLVSFGVGALVAIRIASVRREKVSRG